MLLYTYNRKVTERVTTDSAFWTDPTDGKYLRTNEEEDY